MTKYSLHPLYLGKWNARSKKMENDSSFANLVMSSDETFDEAIRQLDMRGLIGLVSKLQTEMTDEQQHFDELSKQLEMANLNNQDYQFTSSALCASQARLALLCARNMKCFTQQAVKAKQEQEVVVSKSSSSEHTKADISCRSHQNPPPQRFQQKLLFFEDLHNTTLYNQREEQEEDRSCYLFSSRDKESTLNSSLSSPNLSYETTETETETDGERLMMMGKKRANHHTEAATSSSSNKSGPFTTTCWVEDGLMCARSSARFHSLPRSAEAGVVEQSKPPLVVVGERLSRRVKSLDDGLNSSFSCQAQDKIERVPSVEDILRIVKDLRMRSNHVDSGAVVTVNGNGTSNIVRRDNNNKPEPIYVNVSRTKDQSFHAVPSKVIPVDRSESVVPTATQLVLQATSKAYNYSAKDDEDALFDCDKDSLEEDEEEDDDHQPPDIPSPDYGSDAEEDAAYGVYGGFPGEYAISEVEDDARMMYYVDDQILEVIVEEEETDGEDEEDDEDYNSGGPFEEKGSSMDYSSLGQSTNKSVRSSEMNGEECDTSDDSSTQREGINGNHDSRRDNKLRSSVLIQSEKSDFSDSAVDLHEFSASNGQLIHLDSIDSQDSYQFSSDNELNFRNLNHASTPKTRERSKSKFRSPVNNVDEAADGKAKPKQQQQQQSDNVDASSRSVRAPNHQKADRVRLLLNGNSVTETTKMSEYSKRDFCESDDDDDNAVVAPSLPSVKALRSQFEVKQNGSAASIIPLPRNLGTFTQTTRRPKPPSSFSGGWADDGGVETNQAHFTQTLPLRHSRSTANQGSFKQPIPEPGCYSFDRDRKSYTLPKQQAQRTPPAYYHPLQNGSSVRTAKPIFSPDPPESPDDLIPSIIAQFGQAALNDEFSRPATSLHWDPSLLLKELYTIQSPQPTYSADASVSFINIEGYVDKLPSGRKKATFWNAWKRKFFRLKDGYLHYYQNHSADTPSLTLNLMGGHVDSMDTAMLGIDDGKGHYVVIRCSNQGEMDQWQRALKTHTAENFSLTYVQPVPAYPHFYEDVVIIDLGSTSVRAGILCTQPTLPQLLFPTVYTIHRDSGKRVYGLEAFSPLNRSKSNLVYPLRQSSKITKQCVDLDAIAGLFNKVFVSLNVDPQDYQVQLCLPRSMSIKTQGDVLQMLFEEFEVKSVNLTTQTVLSLLSYNAASGIVVDLGERLDVVPIIDGYVVESGVAKIPYGGARIIEHLRHFLLKRQCLLSSDVDSYIARYVLEQVCYCAEKYNEELHRFYSDPDAFEKVIDLTPFFSDPPWEEIVLDSGAFQAPEGIFNPDAWGLDHPGIHKLVHKAIQECSLDIRKEMTRSIYLSGGLTLLPGFGARLELEVGKLTPPSLAPKVHGSPYRYHAAYLGACVLAGSAGFQETKITRRDWLQNGANCLKKWHL